MVSHAKVVRNETSAVAELVYCETSSPRELVYLRTIENRAIIRAFVAFVHTYFVGKNT